MRCPVSNISKITNQKSILDKVTQKKCFQLLSHSPDKNYSDTKILYEFFTFVYSRVRKWMQDFNT